MVSFLFARGRPSHISPDENPPTPELQGYGGQALTEGQEVTVWSSEFQVPGSKFQFPGCHRDPKIVPFPNSSSPLRGEDQGGGESNLSE